MSALGFSYRERHPNQSQPLSLQGQALRPRAGGAPAWPDHFPEHNYAAVDPGFGHSFSGIQVIPGEHSQLRFSVQIPRVEAKHGGDRKGHKLSPAHDYYERPHEKQEPASELDPMATEETEKDPSDEIPEMEVGQTIQLPEVTASEVVQPLGDRIYAGFGTVSGIRHDPQVALGANDFGITQPGKYPTKTTLTTGSGYYKVFFAIDIVPKYNVRSSLGPVNQINISNEYDLNINAENYPDVVKDLTPTKRTAPPPRHEWWSRLLVLRHERFHAWEFVEHASLGVDRTMKWISSLQPASDSDAIALFKQVPTSVARWVISLAPGAEDRAYDDGFDTYMELSNKIRSIGKNGGYPSARKCWF